ncbi:MAG: patatin family protein [Treponema sp.]|nr:patatin family protein [Treponema sp.]
MENTKFQEPVQKGQKYKTMLKQGTALVLEGGGTRAYYTAGVLEAFMEKGIMFPYIIGVSAGVGNALSYISGQSGRNRTLIEKFTDHRYAGLGNLIKYGSIFNYDFIFGTVPNELLFWDKEVYDKNETRFLIGATDCNTGEALWFEKHDLCEEFMVARASCSVPFLSKIVKYKGLHLLDGGIAAAIPIEKSVADGNTFHVIVLTRNANYVKAKSHFERMAKLFYRKYPKLVEVLLKRHEAYQSQIALCEQLEREGKAIIIRPQNPIRVGRVTTNTEKLLALYEEGLEEGRGALRGVVNLPAHAGKT